MPTLETHWCWLLSAATAASSLSCEVMVQCLLEQAEDAHLHSVLTNQRTVLIWVDQSEDSLLYLAVLMLLRWWSCHCSLVVEEEKWGLPDPWLESPGHCCLVSSSVWKVWVILALACHHSLLEDWWEWSELVWWWQELERVNLCCPDQSEKIIRYHQPIREEY